MLVSASQVPQRVVRCPKCGGNSLYAESNPSRPFCSARCKNNDFSQWASEGYRVESAPGTEEPDAGEI